MSNHELAYHKGPRIVEYETPQFLFDDLNKEFDFTLDPCATETNTKVDKFFTAHDNGLIQTWASERVFMNPPYGREISKWTYKALLEINDCCELVVGLLPARTDTKWFHNHIYHKTEIRFLKGRLHFNNSKQGAPFPSMVVIWK